MICANIGCLNEIPDYRIEKIAQEGSKYRFCGSCIMRHKSMVSWKCKGCDSEIHSTVNNFNKLYCSANCRKRFKYKMRPRQVTFKICRICGIKMKHLVGEWTKFYCKDCKHKFKERWEAEQRCIVCNKEMHNRKVGTQYCTATCRMRAHLMLKGIDK